MHQKNFRNQIDAKYILKCYMISLSWTGVFFLIFYWASEYEMLSFFIIYGTLFPFAKMVCDLLVGFKLDYKIKHSVVWNNIFLCINLNLLSIL